MKKLLTIPFLLLLVALSVFATRSTNVINISPCDFMTINVTGTNPIDAGEYNILGCTGDTTTNIWRCGCATNKKFNVVLSTLDTTINNYTFTINYLYNQSEYQSVSVTTPVSRSSGGGGGGGCWIGYKIVNGTCVKTNQTVVPFIRPKVNTTQNTTTNVTNTTTPVVATPVTPPPTPQPTPPPVVQPQPQPVVQPAPTVPVVAFPVATPEPTPTVQNATGVASPVEALGWLKILLIVFCVAIVVFGGFFWWILRQGDKPPKEPKQPPPEQPTTPEPTSYGPDDPRNPKFYENL